MPPMTFNETIRSNDIRSGVRTVGPRTLQNCKRRKQHGLNRCRIFGRELEDRGFREFLLLQCQGYKHDSTEGINELKEDERGFWNIVNPGDIAWAVTKRVDNEEKWMESYYKDKETRSPGRKSKKRGAVDAEKGTTKALWTMTCKGWVEHGR